MTDKLVERTHTEILLDLIDRWQAGTVTNQVLIRDLSGMAMNTDYLETDKAALEQRVEGLENHAATLADCVNLELRESGEFAAQIEDYLGDMRPFIRKLVDANRALEDECAALVAHRNALEQRLERLEEAVHLAQLFPRT